MENTLNSKKVLLAAWGCENEQDTHMHQIWYTMLKKVFSKLETFDTKKNYFQYGKEEMNKSLFDNLNKQNPELVIFLMDNDEISPETFEKIGKFKPEIKTLLIICDDDAKFDNWSRYFALFFDGIIQSPSKLEDYKKEGFKNVFFHFDYNTYKLEPLDIEKKYDITFVGRPKADRYEIIKYLHDNGVKVGIFGWDWYQFPEFKDIYQGPLNQEDYTKVINQSKISLSLTKAGAIGAKGQYNMKGRFFEVALCKSFQIIEYYPGVEEFFKNKEEAVFFKSKEELLEQVKYYLKHEKQRDKLAENSYKKVLSKFNRETDLIRIFTKVFNEKTKLKNLPEINKKSITLTKEDLNLDSKKIKEKIKDCGYISFSQGKHENLPHKDFFQKYSLEKTNKPISCCDYYVHSKSLGDYLLFTSKFAFKKIGNKASKFVNINQLMVRKDYFLKNLVLFKKLFNGETINLLNEKNTAFISIPLVRIQNLKPSSYEDIKQSFDMIFIKKLFSLVYQKKILTNTYAYKLVLRALIKQTFILKYLLESLKGSQNWDKISVNKSYMKDSVFEKYARKK